MIENIQWYAIYTKPRWEKKVALLLEQKGIENYCPLNKTIKQWKDRKKIILEPLFKSYVFVKININNKVTILRTSGVVNFVYWLKNPAIIKKEEINNIKNFLNEFENVEVEKIDLQINTKVKITKGIFMDYKGTIIKILGNKATIKIDSMGVQLHAIVDKKIVENIKVYS